MLNEGNNALDGAVRIPRTESPRAMFYRFFNRVSQRLGLAVALQRFKRQAIRR